MSTPALNGYTLTKHFRDLRHRLTFTPLEAYLFFELVALCNDDGWKAEFSAKNSKLVDALNSSWPGIWKARKTLVAAGLLTYKEGQNRKPTTYCLIPPKGLTELNLWAQESAPEPLTEPLTELNLPAENEGKGLTECLTELNMA